MNTLDLCLALSEINLKDWQQLIVDTEQVYAILNSMTFDSFKTAICAFSLRG